MPEQLKLRFPLRRDLSFANFAVGANRELLQQLTALPQASGFIGYWIWGGAELGKTHLLQAVCQVHGGRVGYLPLAEVPPDSDADSDGSALDATENFDLLALDDVDRWLGDDLGERALQAVYQGLVNGGGKLVVTSSVAPNSAEFVLPDLASRLRALQCHQLLPLADEDKHRLLVERAHEQGLTLEDSVVRYWLRRADRELSQLLHQLAVVSEASLQENRRITIPLLKRVLNFRA